MLKKSIFLKYLLPVLIVSALLSGCRKAIQEEIKGPQNRSITKSVEGSVGVQYYNEPGGSTCITEISWQVPENSGFPLPITVSGLGGSGLYWVYTYFGSISIPECVAPGTVISATLKLVNNEQFSASVVVPFSGGNGVPVEGDPAAPVPTGCYMDAHLTPTELTIYLEWGAPNSNPSGSKFYINLDGSPGQQASTVTVYLNEGHATISVPRYDQGGLYTARLTFTNIKYPVMEMISTGQPVECIFNIDPQASGAHWTDWVVGYPNIQQYYAPAD